MAKSKKAKSSPTKVDLPPTEIPIERPISPPKDIKHIRIALQGYMNIPPLFSFSTLTTQAKYMDTDLGCSTETPVIDDDCFPTHHEFIIECDINSAMQLDNLVSNPVMFTVFENPGQPDAGLGPQPGTTPPKFRLQDGEHISAETAGLYYELFTGKTAPRATFCSVDLSEGGQGESSRIKVDKEIDWKSGIEFVVDPVLLGTTALDLLPLFLGQAKFTETLLLVQTQKFYDDAMIPRNITPRLIVEVSIDEDLWLKEDPNSNVLSLTIESVFNIPLLMSDVMQYKTSMFLPSAFGEWGPVVVSGGKLKENVETYKLKRWPGMMDNEGLKGCTKYRIDDSYETIKNQTDISLDEVLNSEKPRIEWNILKRNFLNEEAVHEFLYRLRRYRRLPLELYVTNAQQDALAAESSVTDKGNLKSVSSKSDKGKPKSATSKSDKGKSVSSKSDKGKPKSKEKSKVEDNEPKDYLHLMTAVDVSTLLYPGVKKCRVVCPLNTYQQAEILEQTGLTNSYFMPSVEVPTSDGSDKKKDKKAPPSGGSGKKKGGDKKSASGGSDKKKGGDKKSASGGSSKKKGGKGAKTPVSVTKTDLKPLLPPPPVIILEPSTPVYSEKGERTFILIEIELIKPLQPKRKVEDLSADLLFLLPKRPPTSKVVVSSRLTQLHFKDVIKQLTEDLIHQHRHYLKEKNQCKCDKYEGTPQMAFLTFLQRTGVYQTYLTSFTKAASLMVNDKFPFIGEASQSNKDYQNFIAKTYSTLIKEMNGTLNELSSSGAEIAPVSPLMELDPLLLYAREACEIGAYTLADRYHLERICADDKNANSWFDYAVFQLEIENKEKALECVKQCLVINNKHHYSLLLCGILLTEKSLYDEAETCLLSAIFQKPTWLEGWCVLHLFYIQTGNGEGTDLGIEMANKYLKTPVLDKDYFNSIDDLAWTSATCPHSIYLQTAVLLIKMRAFNFAEKALALEKTKKSGIYYYYLAVITYYCHDYDHSLMHLKEAENLHGTDYGIGSLKGHCFLGLEDLQNAKEEYMRILESFDRPDDVHLLYIYLALIWERLGEKHFARKLLLLACKYSPTPYTWLGTGLLYYGQKDLLSAEQCLTQANLCDSRLPEIWGYLVLINLELQRYSEAELCYKQAKKNRMENQTLARKIQNAMKSFK